jgi:hypothetical protein
MGINGPKLHLAGDAKLEQIEAARAQAIKAETTYRWRSMVASLAANLFGSVRESQETAVFNDSAVIEICVQHAEEILAKAWESEPADGFVL